ncbi:aminoacyl-histidine dipeptidase [uncultured Fusobacterium sp.]|uniref:aminoacyl-histidine dipeptidase n=1 Tax=uncultured Fusobacterium sp. TaxID=159267 RepID=UPI0025837222|nr:aminoacyl-histidine dipeptidase [uncultured Fusobacterium sp.]
MLRKLEGLKPERVFYYFEEISKIPRESYNEKEISDYLIEFGKRLNLETYQDKHYNVILRKKGCEDLPTVIIQGHMDMVCEKENESNHDFKKDPIKLVVDKNILRADKTTLGGDNAIALAMGMAILEDESIKNGIELLVTTSEEVDLNGALSLEPNLLKGKMLINLDSEDEGIVTVGSAGGVEIDIALPITKHEVPHASVYTIVLDKLQGGHSGTEINQNRCNANKIMAELLEELSKDDKFTLVEISGGSKDNAIPRRSKAIIASNENMEDKIIIACNKLKEKYIKLEPEIHFEVETTIGKNIIAISKESFKKYLKTIKELPTGVNTMMKEYPEIVESSDNLAIVKTLDDCINIIISLRSSEPSVLEELKNKISDILKDNEAKFEFSAGYPEWRFRADSKLRDKALEVYKKMYNKDMKVEVIHAGLECGAISQNYSDIDFISIGPNLREVHTPSEYLEIDSVERVYNYLIELIKSL